MGVVFSLKDIAEATGGVLYNTPDETVTITGVSTDTRTIGAGEAFFALIGENHDAHDHLEGATEKGIALLVVNDKNRVPSDYTGAVLAVEDTLAAYQALSASYLKGFDPLVIAVTGSAGKTTLKDMIACILSENIQTYFTQGNLNNQIGLPRTVLETSKDVKALVLEMGLFGAGDIERLSDICRPKIAAITNIGVSHRENFDSDDGILNAKYEIAAFMGEGETLVIDAGGNEKLKILAEEGSNKKGYKLIKVCNEGSFAENDSDYIVSQVRVSEENAGVSLFEIRERSTGAITPFCIPLPGAYSGISAAIASAVSIQAGALLGIEIKLEDAAEALSQVKRTPHRLDPIKKNGILVIDDTYNASPDSAKAGLSYLKSVPAKKRIAILADMNELGTMSDEMHENVGEAAILEGVDIVFAYGTKAKRIEVGAKQAIEKSSTFSEKRVFWFDAQNKDLLIERILNKLEEGDAVYIKGSRSMKMEDVVMALTEEKNGNV